MDPITVFFLALVMLLVLLALGMPIAFALLIVSAGGILEIRGPRAAMSLLSAETHGFSAHWTLSAIPMFLLMGSFAYRGGLTTSLFEAGRVWLGRLPGGLAVASNVATAVFAAASGSSVATSAAMARLAAPEMLKAGYSPGLAGAVIAAAGTIGALIPPSILFVIYAWITQENVSQLLMAGLLPGILTAVVYTAMIIIRCRLQPSIAPQTYESYSWSDRWSITAKIWPIPVLMIVVLGTIFFGIATTTEAAALGSLAAVALIAVRGDLTFGVFRDSVRDALTSSASLFFIAMGAALFAKLLALSGIPPLIGETIAASNLSSLQLILIVILLYLLLGMFLDPIGILLITLPILLPAFNALEMNLIWVGVLLVKLIEIGMLTPPVGLNVFVVKSAMGDTAQLGAIFRSVSWFLLAEAVIVALLVFFPQISLMLPKMMAD